MRADFSTAFYALKNHLSEKMPELGKIITHWEDPFLVSKNRAILLPDAHSGAGNSVNFSVMLWASVVEAGADGITDTQLILMERLFDVIYGSLPSPIISATIGAADYFDPDPRSPLVGLLHLIITMTTDYSDDCGSNYA